MNKLLNKIDIFINEISTPGRAWSGKLKKIDELLSRMYDKNILTKTEKAEKDKTFSQYYRYYNDGDIPHGMKYTNKQTIEQTIETNIENFIRKILSKYWNKMDRNSLKLDKLIDMYSYLLYSVEDDEYFNGSSVKNWANDINYLNNSELYTLINNVLILSEKLNEKLDFEINNLKISNDTYIKNISTNIVLSIKYKNLLDMKVLSAEHIKLWNELSKARNSLAAYIKNLIISLEELQQFRKK